MYKNWVLLSLFIKNQYLFNFFILSEEEIKNLSSAYLLFYQKKKKKMEYIQMTNIEKEKQAILKDL